MTAATLFAIRAAHRPKISRLYTATVTRYEYEDRNRGFLWPHGDSDAITSVRVVAGKGGCSVDILHDEHGDIASETVAVALESLAAAIRK